MCASLVCQRLQLTPFLLLFMQRLHRVALSTLGYQNIAALTAGRPMQVPGCIAGTPALGRRL